MILRRPSQTDKEAILEMMAEFEREQAAHDGGFWNADNFVYEEWLEENLQAEAGLNIPENWVPAIQLVSFDEADHALGFLNLCFHINHLHEVVSSTSDCDKTFSKFCCNSVPCFHCYIRHFISPLSYATVTVS